MSKRSYLDHLRCYYSQSNNYTFVTGRYNVMLSRRLIKIKSKIFSFAYNFTMNAHRRPWTRPKCAQSSILLIYRKKAKGRIYHLRPYDTGPST